MSKDNKTEVEPYYLRRGEELIDNLFDKHYFREDVKREELRGLDDLVGFLFQSGAESAVRVDRITRSLKESTS